MVGVGRQVTPSGAEPHTQQGVAPGKTWPLHFDAMTDPEDKPSFLARLSILGTIAAIVMQMTMSFEPASRDAMVVTMFIPGSLFMGIAGVYYLFKGKPMGADSVIAGRLYQAWGASLLGGALIYMLSLRN